MSGELRLTGVVPSAPNRGFRGTYGKRRFVSSKQQQPPQQPATTQTIPRSPIKTQPKRSVARNRGDIAQLQEVLQQDIEIMATVQQEVREEKAKEVERCKLQIEKLRRTWDELKLDVERKTARERELQRTCQALQAQISAHEQAKAQASNQLEDLQTQFEDVQHELADAQTTKRIFQHMLTRLLDELDQARQEVAAITQREKEVDKELHQAEHSLRTAQNELRADQSAFEKVLQDSTQRKHLRESQFTMLLELFDEERGQASSSRNSERKATTTQQSPEKQIRKESIFDHITLQFLQGIAPKPYLGLEQVKAQKPFSAGRSARSNESEPIDESQTLRQLVELMGPLSVAEFVDRVNNHSVRRDKLAELEQQMRQRIDDEQAKRKELEEGFDRVTDKREEVLGKQLYHNTQDKQSALSNARTRLEESKRKAQHMEMTIEGLKQTIARLLTKVTSTAQPIPNNEQLPDMIHKLNEELTRLIKQIASALMKGTQHSMEGNSIERPSFQKLPGYRKVSRILFNKMIAASVDVSPRNLRIPRPEHLEEDAPPALETQDSEELLTQPADVHERVLDRDTLKRITQLIVNREKLQTRGRKREEQHEKTQTPRSYVVSRQQSL